MGEAGVGNGSGEGVDRGWALLAGVEFAHGHSVRRSVLEAPAGQTPQELAISTDIALVSTIIDWAEMLTEHDYDCIGVVIIDRDLRIRAISDSVLERGGYSRDEMLELTALDVVHPEDLVRAAEVISEVLVIDGERPPGMYRLVFSDGSWDSFQLQAVNLGDAADGAVVMRFTEASREVRERSFVEEFIEITQLLVETRTTAESIGRIVDFAERHLNNATVAVTTFASDGTSSTLSRGELSSEVAAENAAAHPLSLPSGVGEAYALQQAGPWRVNNRAGLLCEDSNRVIIALLDDGGALLGYAQSFRVDTDDPVESEWLVYAALSQILRAVLIRHGLDNQLRFAADHDSLTGLTNRRRLLEVMDGQSELGGTGLLVIDLDKFSWVNNTLGHAAGDTALIAAANCMRSVVPDDAVVARLGGDEFVLWMPTVESLDDINRLAETVRGALVVPIDSADRRSLIRCSVGAVAIRAGESAEEAINRADQAMYEAKRSGGDRVKSA